MQKGTIILICGLPGSGKSTLAKKLEKERNAILLNADEWILGIIKSRSDIKEIDRLRNPVERLLLTLAKKLALKGNTVILDNGFWTISDRKKYLDFIKNPDINTELHFMNANKNLIFKRLHIRNENPPEHDFEMDMKKMERWIEIFEVPTTEEIKSFDFYQKYDQI
jgi:predicted kinase